MSQEEYDALRQIARQPIRLHGDIGMPGSSAPPMRILAKLQAASYVTRIPDGAGQRIVITAKGRVALGPPHNPAP